MRIGGLIRNSFIDYPACISAVVFTQGCNYRCPFCHNPFLVLEESEGISEREVLAFLKKRSQKNLLDAVVISGGEPTLQGDLIDFIKKVKSNKYLLKLDTNGSRPFILKELLEKELLDYVAMDIKAPVGSYGQLCGVEVNYIDIERSIDILSSFDIFVEFRTTAFKPLLTIEDLLSIGKSLPRGSKYTVQQFVNSNILDSSFSVLSDEESIYGEEEILEVVEELKSFGLNCSFR